MWRPERWMVQLVHFRFKEPCSIGGRIYLFTYEKCLCVSTIAIMSMLCLVILSRWGHLYSKMDMMLVQENKRVVCFFLTVDVRAYIEKGVKSSKIGKVCFSTLKIVIRVILTAEMKIKRVYLCI